MTAALTNAVERSADDAVQEALRWVSQVNEKVAWCSDVSGNKSSILSKQMAVRELAESASVGSERIQAALRTVELVELAMPEAAEKMKLGEQAQTLQDQWLRFLTSVDDTR